MGLEFAWFLSFRYCGMVDRPLDQYSKYHVFESNQGGFVLVNKYA